MSFLFLNLSRILIILKAPKFDKYLLDLSEKLTLSENFKFQFKT